MVTSSRLKVIQLEDRIYDCDSTNLIPRYHKHHTSILIKVLLIYLDVPLIDDMYVGKDHIILKKESTLIDPEILQKRSPIIPYSWNVIWR